MRKIKSLILIMTMALALFAGCGKVEYSSEAPEDPLGKPEQATTSEGEDLPITIVYTNDVHSYIANVVKDEEGNVTGDGLRFSKIAAMVNDLRDAGENVLLVDAGDEIQGDIYGAFDEGESIINIMSATGYQLAVPGNHDFDYGVSRLCKLAGVAEFSYTSCNFHLTDDEVTVFPGTNTFDIAGKKVAFVGVTTPGTLTSSTPVYFQDESGNFIYTFDGLKSANDLYESVQKAIDSVRDEADYVIGLGHLGVGKDEEEKGWTSTEVISNVSGLDAFIDGHSHTTIEGDSVKDKDGKDVVLTQTGCYLNNVGVMTISPDGSISTKLVSDYEREDEKVAQLEKTLIDEIELKMSEKIGTLESPLYICNPDNENERWIRAKELNLGDFVADSTYWYFNEKIGVDCDIAVCNGGGIRNKIDAGELTYATAKTVQPFGNMICLISATGQQIVDALEMGVTAVGEWNDEWNSPAENGGFLHVAGLSYTIDSTVPSSVETDSNEMFTGVAGEYRVKDVKVYNKETKEYEPIDLNKTYMLGGINYILRNGGNGLSMFASDELIVDYVGEDYIILAEYIQNFDKAVVNTKNSPLSKYEGYLLDYENPLGAGRINIITE